MKPLGIFSRQKGQALIETALILPVVILIITGIIDFGLIFNHYTLISNAAREGARSAAIGIADAKIRADIAEMTASLKQSKLKITILPAESLRKKGDPVSVLIEYDNQLITPVISAIISNPVHLKAKTVMRFE